MKTHTTLTVDPELIEKAKAFNINLSGTFNEYLLSIINKKQNNLEGINIELELIKQKKLQNQFNNIKSELDLCNDNIRKYQELEQEREKKELEKEKERMEKATKCINCGSFLDDKKKVHTFNNGNVCNSCFMSSSSEQITKWNSLV